jgi:hypothetical protein
MESTNGSRKHELTAKQQAFFQNGRMAIQRLNEQMNGALQYICMENDLQGSKISLSEDASCIIIDGSETLQ